jgi:hypothetical protein
VPSLFRWVDVGFQSNVKLQGTSGKDVFKEFQDQNKRSTFNIDRWIGIAFD